MKDEKDFWDRHRPHLNKHGHFERVENGAGIGTPDVDYCIKGAHGKIELKYIPSYPARGTTRVFGHRGLRTDQGAWAALRLHHGGRVFLMAGVERDFGLWKLNRMLIKEFNDLSKAELKLYSCYFREGGYMIDYGRVIEILKGA